MAGKCNSGHFVLWPVTLYNHLNLPATVSMPGDKTLTYYYDATGRKLSQVLATSSTVTKKTDYANEYIYENDTLQFINTAEGRYVAKLESESNTATLETANEAAEQAKFLRYSNAKRVNSTCLTVPTETLQVIPNA